MLDRGVEISEPTSNTSPFVDTLLPRVQIALPGGEEDWPVEREGGLRLSVEDIVRAEQDGEDGPGSAAAAAAAAAGTMGAAAGTGAGVGAAAVAGVGVTGVALVTVGVVGLGADGGDVPVGGTMTGGPTGIPALLHGRRMECVGAA